MAAEAPPHSCRAQVWEAGSLTWTGLAARLGLESAAGSLAPAATVAAKYLYALRDPWVHISMFHIV
jgi:hypothetical protein